jgi:hypothetical protein
MPQCLDSQPQQCRSVLYSCAVQCAPCWVICQVTGLLLVSTPGAPPHVYMYMWVHTNLHARMHACMRCHQALAAAVPKLCLSASLSSSHLIHPLSSSSSVLRPKVWPLQSVRTCRAARPLVCQQVLRAAAAVAKTLQPLMVPSNCRTALGHKRGVLQPPLPANPPPLRQHQGQLCTCCAGACPSSSCLPYSPPAHLFQRTLCQAAALSNLTCCSPQRLACALVDTTPAHATKMKSHTPTTSSEACHRCSMYHVTHTPACACGVM